MWGGNIPISRVDAAINKDGLQVFENGVPQVVHPNMVMVASTLHVQLSPRNKIIVGGGCTRGLSDPWTI